MHGFQERVPDFFRGGGRRPCTGPRLPGIKGLVIVDTRTNKIMTGEGFKCFTANAGMYGGGKPLLPGFLNGRQAKLFFSPVILAKKAGKSGQIDNKGFMTDYSRSGSQLTYLKSPKKSIVPIS